jgi:elongation factor 1-gamma
VLITALLTKTPYSVHYQNPVSCKSEEYLKIHPFGKIPAAQTPEGPLYESNTISRYFARKSKSLYGSNLFEETLVDQWLDTIRSDMANSGKFVYAIFGFPDSFLKYKLKNFQTDLAELVKFLKVIDGRLGKKHFLVGDKLSLADVTLVTDLSYFFKFLFTDKERKELPHITPYFERIVALPEFRAVLGKIEFPEKPFTPLIVETEDKKDKKDKKKGDKGDKKDKKDDKKDEKKDKKEKKDDKKEEKKKEAKEEENDEVQEEKPKTYNFPETKFDLFAFKTLYVNAPNKKDALDFLWQNWDENAFSFWHLTYDKLPSEGKKLFLTNNLMNGFLDRADQSRKYALGVHGVYGDEPDLDVKGVWLWRGTDILEPLKEHQQFDVYKYRKMDPKNPADKQLIEDYWTKLEEDKDVVEGKTARTLKYFK